MSVEVPTAPPAPNLDIPLAPAPVSVTPADEQEKAAARMSFLQNQFSKLLASVDDEEENDDDLSDEDDGEADPSPLQKDSGGGQDKSKIEMLEREVSVLTQRFGGNGEDVDADDDEEPKEGGAAGKALAANFAKLKELSSGPVPTAPPLPADASAKERRRYERKFNKQQFILRQFMRIMVKMQTKEDDIIFEHRKHIAAALLSHDKSKMKKMDAKRTDFSEVARKTAYLAPKAIKGAADSANREALTATETRSDTHDHTKQAWLMEMSIKGAAQMDRENLKTVTREADMSTAAMKAAYLGPKAAEAAASKDKSELKKAETKEGHNDAAKEAYLAEQKMYKEAPKTIGEAAAASAVEAKLEKTETRDDNHETNKMLYSIEKTMAKIADTNSSDALTKVETTDNQAAMTILAYAQEKTHSALLNVDKSALKKTKTKEATDANLATAYLGPKAIAEAAEHGALGGKNLKRVTTDADMSQAALKAQYLGPKIIEEVSKEGGKMELTKTETKEGSLEAAKEAYLAEQKMYKEAPKDIALAISGMHLKTMMMVIGENDTQTILNSGQLPDDWDQKKDVWLNKVDIQADMSAASLKAQYLGPKVAIQAAETTVDSLQKTETRDNAESMAKSEYIKEKTLASLATPQASAKLRRVSSPAPTSDSATKTAYLAPRVAAEAASKTTDDLKSVVRPDDNALLVAKAQYVQAKAMKAIGAEDKPELKKTETVDKSVDSAKQAYLDEQKKFKEAPLNLAKALADVKQAPKLKKVEIDADKATLAATTTAVLAPKVIDQAAKEAGKKRKKTKTKDDTQDSAIVAYVHEKNQKELENFDHEEGLSKTGVRDDTSAALVAAYAQEKTMAKIAKGNAQEGLSKSEVDLAQHDALTQAALKAQYVQDKTISALNEAGDMKLKKTETKDSMESSAKEAYLAEQKMFKEAPKLIGEAIEKADATKLEETTTKDLSLESAKLAYQQEKLQSALSKGETKLEKVEEVKDTSMEAAKIAYVAEKTIQGVTSEDNKKKLKNVKSGDANIDATLKNEYMREKSMAAISSGEKKKLNKVERTADMSAAAAKSAYLAPKMLKDVESGEKKLKKSETKNDNMAAVKAGYAAEKKFFEDGKKTILGDLTKTKSLKATKNAAETNSQAAATAARVGPTAAKLAADFSHKALNKTKTTDNSSTLAQESYTREATLKGLEKFNTNVLKSVHGNLKGQKKTYDGENPNQFLPSEPEPIPDSAVLIARAEYTAEKSKGLILAYDRSRLRKIPKNFHRTSISSKALFLGPKAFAAAAEKGKGDLKNQAEQAKAAEQTTLDAAKEAYMAEKKFYQEAPAQIFASIASSGGIADSKLKKATTNDTSDKFMKEQYQREKAIKNAASGSTKLKKTKTVEKTGLKAEAEAASFVASINTAAGMGMNKGMLKKAETQDNSLKTAQEAFLAEKQGAGNPASA
eukprot:gb/GEZN01000375.1/.p1 GENE.gb/GEZN01000375.1/~~gb/GEZN01000375.1/.p1  ORF type:complete len:1440 (+),score=391.51 gb/GEZN01000375.1/:61-4380(+)